MAKRRGKNEGSVYYWEAKNLWVAQVTLSGGKRKKKYGKTQREVQQWLLDRRKSIQANTFDADEKTSVAEFLDHWYESTVSHTLRRKTVQSYKSLTDLHIKPLIGNIRLAQLKPEQLQSLYSRKLDEGYSKRTVQYIHSVMHRALEQAVKWGWVVRNVADAVDAPLPAKKSQTLWTADQARLVL